MFKPLYDFVILCYEKEKERKGVILSDVSHQKKHTARVEAVGPDAKGVKRGDIVAFDPFAPRAIEIDGKELLIIREKFIYGIQK